MKNTIALLLVLLLACIGVSGYAEEAERTVASYEYALTEDGAYYENLIFGADVIVTGDNSQIVFSNCEFNGNIVLASGEGTRVMLLGCDVNGACYIENDVTGVGLEYNNPKFLTTSSICVETGEGVGSVVALGDYEVMFNGEPYTMASSQFFIDANYEFVPYEGQEASYFVAAQYYEGDEKVVMVACEFDPTM